MVAVIVELDFKWLKTLCRCMAEISACHFWVDLWEDVSVESCCCHVDSRCCRVNN